MNSAHMPRRDFLNSIALGAGALALPLGLPQAWAAELKQGAIEGQCNRIPGTKFQLNGPVRNYLSGVTEQWLKVAPISNPAMLEIFRDRDRKPYRDLLPWSGEFAGKHLVSSVQVWRLTGDVSLKASIADFVRRLVPLQAEDGYLGPWPRDSRLTGRAPNVGPKGGDTWDAWGHYHIMLGLLLWHEDTSDEAALSCARRIGDLFCTKFETGRLVDTGSTEMNLAPIHTLCLLYQRTKNERYLKLALKICDEFSAANKDGKPLAGDYLNAALAGKEFFQMPKPRWESLHPIMGLAELYHITKDEKYRRAFEHIWWSIVKLDRHNNGGFSSGEQAQGNPYHRGAIETCCTIAWCAMSVEMLRLTQNSIAADELELSTLNSVMGLHSPNGRWVTYDTPMDGTRKASAHDIVFQARAGSPELNCCSVNGSRGFGLISDWAIMSAGNRTSVNSIILNWYGPSNIQTRLPSGIALTLKQVTEYPGDGRVRIEVSPEKASEFELLLRIPHWSKNTRVNVTGSGLPRHGMDGSDIRPGTYFPISRKWRRGDAVEISFDFSLHYWAGEREYEGKTSIYRGPLLLTYDRRFNEMDPEQIPALDARSLDVKLIQSNLFLPPTVLVEFRATDGRPVRVCDFASAGVGGSPYRSWLEVKNVKKSPFSQKEPLRSGRVAL